MTFSVYSYITLSLLPPPLDRHCCSYWAAQSAVSGDWYGFVIHWLEFWLVDTCCNWTNALICLDSGPESSVLTGSVLVPVVVRWSGWPFHFTAWYWVIVFIYLYTNINLCLVSFIFCFRERVRRFHCGLKMIATLWAQSKTKGNKKPSSH